MAQEPTARRTRAQSAAQRRRADKIVALRGAGVLAAAVVLAVFAIAGLLFFARPVFSRIERRTLERFPTLSWESFWDGSFFSDTARWYDDTYPLREQLLSASQGLEGLRGIDVAGADADHEADAMSAGTTTTTGQIGGSVPAVPETSSEDVSEDSSGGSL